MQVDVSEGQPCSVPVKIRPYDLLHPDDPCVKVDAFADVADHKGDVVSLAPVGSKVCDARVGWEVSFA